MVSAANRGGPRGRGPGGSEVGACECLWQPCLEWACPHIPFGVQHPPVHAHIFLIFAGMNPAPVKTAMRLPPGLGKVDKWKSGVLGLLRGLAAALKVGAPRSWRISLAHVEKIFSFRQEIIIGNPF